MDSVASRRTLPSLAVSVVNVLRFLYFLFQFCCHVYPMPSCTTRHAFMVIDHMHGYIHFDVE